jgi:hypothetical protein
VRGAGKHRRPHRHIGRPPRHPGAIAPQYLALFADIAHPRQRAYLAAYVQERGAQTKTRKTAGGGGSHYRWLGQDPDYRAAFARARLAVADAVERDIYARAGAAASSETALIARLGRLTRKGYGESR